MCSQLNTTVIYFPERKNTHISIFLGERQQCNNVEMLQAHSVNGHNLQQRVQNVKRSSSSELPPCLSDSLLPPKQESGVVDLGGMPPPSPHTCMSRSWLQYPRSSKFIDPWSNTVATWLWLTVSAGMMRCVSLGRIAKQKLPREEG